MPQVANGPKTLNELLERVYGSCIASGKDKGYCSRVSWQAAHDAGWYKDPKSGKWRKKDFSKAIALFEKREKAVTQSILLSRRRFKTKEMAIKWLKDHGKKFGNIEETDKYWRARQRDMKDFKDRTFRTYEIDDGIKLILGRLK